MSEEKISEMSEEKISEIREIYDNNLNMTLGQLSMITGISISELKFILTCLD